MTDYWQRAREAMLLNPKVTYLNTGSYGPTAKVVFQRVSELRHRLQSSPVDFLWRESPELLWYARETLADFLHADPFHLIFTVNVTAALNQVAASIELDSPGEILITDHIYGSAKFIWERAAKRLGLNLRMITLPTLPDKPEVLIDTVTSAFQPQTRLLVIDHILHTTGMVMPLTEICHAAREHNIITVIDGAHAPGMIPVNLQQIDADFYGGNCHKWLLAPIGAGFLYVHPGNEGRIAPLTVSWGWYYDHAQMHDRDEFGSTPWIRSFEFEGTRDPCPWLTVPTAVAFLKSLDTSLIRQRHLELSDYSRQCLDGICGLKLVTPQQGELRGAITAFRLPQHDLLTLRRRIWEDYRIEVNIIEHVDGNLLRISTNFYNTEEEIDYLKLAMSELL